MRIVFLIFTHKVCAKNCFIRSDIVRFCMGSCSSRSVESGLIPNQEVDQEHPVQTVTQAADSAMGERLDINRLAEPFQCAFDAAKETFQRCDELQRSYREIQERNDQLKAENESLRQRYVIRNFNV